VRRLLKEHSIAAADIGGTGRDGRITAQDVIRHAANAVNAVNGANTASRAHVTGAPDAAKQAPAAHARTQGAAVSGTRVPHTAIRRRVAEHMARSLAEAPHVTTLFEADLSRVVAHRARHAEEYAARGARLTLTAYFVRACAQALGIHREVNATFHADALELHADVNIGIGTALGDKGLIVPVLRRTQDLSLLETARRLHELVAAARAGKLVPDDVRGGTFTISNHGVGGSLLAAPIVINQPQVAILGVGKVERRVCVIDAQGEEAIAIRSMCYLTLSLDHRALDAFQANAFLTRVVGILETWPQ
jgi:2-oxoglutarate dehydrogenase E2 component (dihydrolipoamide succinyltransferase)